VEDCSSESSIPFSLRVQGDGGNAGIKEGSSHSWPEGHDMGVEYRTCSSNVQEKGLGECPGMEAGPAPVMKRVKSRSYDARTVPLHFPVSVPGV